VRSYTWFCISHPPYGTYHALTDTHALCSSRIKPGGFKHIVSRSLIDMIAITHIGNGSICKSCLKRIKPTKNEITQADVIAVRIEADNKKRLRKQNIHARARNKLEQSLITGNGNIVTCSIHGGKWRVSEEVVSYDEPGFRWPNDNIPITLPCGCLSPYVTFDNEHCTYWLTEITTPSIPL
jgi:hypothetical protein